MRTNWLAGLFDTNVFNSIDLFAFTILFVWVRRGNSSRFQSCLFLCKKVTEIKYNKIIMRMMENNVIFLETIIILKL